LYKLFIKRLADIILSFVGIILLAVPMLFIAIAIKADDPGPIFFIQKSWTQKERTAYIFFTLQVQKHEDVYSS
jgi:O-antigen biosynthesis protein WbqP